MRWFIRFLTFVVATIGLLVLLLWLTGYGYLIKGVRLSYLSGYKSANIYDGRKFDTRALKAPAATDPLPHSYRYNQVPLPEALREMLDKTHSASFLVLQHDSIVWEHYFEPHTDTTRSNSFSMAKTITVMLVQKAIEEGKIKSWDEKVQNWLPWLGGPYAGELTLHHLSTMTAGLDWEESYFDPFGITARAYYDDDIEKVMHRVSVIYKPGESYVYQSGATQLLGLCLSKALEKPVGSFAEATLWQSIGAEASATWHTDHPDGMELTYCCFNAITRDFARIGKMVLHRGATPSGQFINPAFFTTATTAPKVPWYGQSFWLSQSGNIHWHMLHGAQGQFIIVIPEKDMVIVRTGNKLLKSKKSKIPECAQTYADQSIATLAGNPH